VDRERDTAAGYLPASTLARRAGRPSAPLVVKEQSWCESPLDPAQDALRIAMLAPPWIPIPPSGYGGIEEVVSLLCEGLVARGHRVTLFAAPRSRSPADVQPLLESAHPDEIQQSLWEVDHVARGFDAIDAAAEAGDRYDVVHDHTSSAAIAMADRLDAPVVHTLHGPFDPVMSAFYDAHGHKGALVAISASQRDAAPAALRDSIEVVHNPLAADRWPFVAEPDDYVLWVGRMTECKGPQRAIRAARMAGVPLVVAGPVQPGQEEFFAREVEPGLDGHAARYVGEVGGERRLRLFAHARALLMPIRWAEPFGMVMVEAMACGTPVIAFPEGSAAEIVIDGENGILVDGERAMARAIRDLDRIDRVRCRALTVERFSVQSAVAGYERVYARVLARRDRFVRRRPPSAFPRPTPSRHPVAAVDPR
jgi:glycosyltransferase involved in cell wall biosynthesis